MGVLYYGIILYISKHFIDRIRERMHVGYFLTDEEIKDCVLDAIEFGLKMCDVQNKMFKQLLLQRCKKYEGDSDIRILDGYVYVFNKSLTTAKTIYPVPYWATYEKNYTC